ncbi:MAG TPA: hypothetical protein PK915_04740, partial [Bacteroidales bacterium]|nr:hypothetical protein [Bacteroidales bacterium]
MNFISILCSTNIPPLCGFCFCCGALNYHRLNIPEISQQTLIEEISQPLNALRNASLNPSTFKPFNPSTPYPLSLIPYPLSLTPSPPLTPSTPEPLTQNPKHETRNTEPLTRNPKRETLKPFNIISILCSTNIPPLCGFCFCCGALNYHRLNIPEIYQQ